MCVGVCVSIYVCVWERKRRGETFVSGALKCVCICACKCALSCTYITNTWMNMHFVQYCKHTTYTAQHIMSMAADLWLMSMHKCICKKHKTFARIAVEKEVRRISQRCISAFFFIPSRIIAKWYLTIWSSKHKEKLQQILKKGNHSGLTGVSTFLKSNQCAKYCIWHT